MRGVKYQRSWCRHREKTLTHQAGERHTAISAQRGNQLPCCELPCGKAQMAENRGKLQADSKQRTAVFSVKVHEGLQTARRMCTSLEVDSLLSWLLGGSLERPWGFPGGAGVKNLPANAEDAKD
ncbi:unnamed protein product [Rangifer tarandus platyrhynchus]|uniref:Uncharacterized protein n=1 Tax=Rangifer tarandus platyrhynchus TaxID=3082113 RepID=A0AC59Y4P2_RANTA